MTTQSEMTILLKLRDTATAGFKKSGGVLDKYKTQLRAGAVAAAGAAVAIEGLARKVAPLNEAVGKLAIQTGLTDKEIRGMATSLSNATFPLDEVLKLMELAAKQGLEGGEAIKQYAEFWDTVGDATGLSSEALAKSGAALKAVGIEVGQETKLLKAFGLIQQNTTGTVGDFLKSIERLAPEMKVMGVTVDDAAVIMTALERELGLTARVARAEFKLAVDQASAATATAQKRFNNLTLALQGVEESYRAGAITQASYDEQLAVLNKSIAAEQEVLDGSAASLAGVLEQLGLTTEQTDKYRAILEESGGVIQANADAHAATKTRLEELQSSLGDVIFKMGPFISQAATLAPLLLVLSPALAALSAAKAIYTTVTGIATTATTAFGVALKVALGPIGLVLLAITALIAIGVLLWKNWDEISRKAKEIWGAIIKFFTETWEMIVALFKDNWELILAILFPPVGIAMLVKKHWGAMVDVVKDIWVKVKQMFKDGINDLIGLINRFIARFNAIRINIPGFSPGFGLPSFPGLNIGVPQIPNIPTLRHGGITDGPTLAVVGDNPGGRELIMPLPRGGGGGLGITINGPLVSVAGNLLGSDLPDVVEGALAELERRGVLLRTA